MPYIPHTEEEIQAMLQEAGVDSLDSLFAEIPANLRCGLLENIPPALSEMEIGKRMRERAAQDAGGICFIGAGAYEHHIPAAVWEITTRGEFYSAYTPYQAEASQGTLQLLYEFQSMMTALTGMDASNASLYDGATALAEAVLMAVRVNRKSKSKKILIPRSVHPTYRKVLHTIVKNQDITLHEIPFINDSGQIDSGALSEWEGQDFAALVLPQPNFFGCLEEVDQLTDWAQEQKALLIAVVNPLSLGLLKPPSEWGKEGVDMVCGEGQPLGIPLSSGGPYFGFLCCKKAYVRQMPGRIIGRTVDLDGKPGYTLTLQAREQHIRRSKATSNICTNQGLMVTAATIYMALTGAEGLRRIATTCCQNVNILTHKLTASAPVETVFNAPVFHEQVLRLPAKTADILRSLAAHNILGGYDLSGDYPELGNALLICATEMRTAREMDNYAEHLQRIISVHTDAGCPVKPKI